MLGKVGSGRSSYVGNEFKGIGGGGDSNAKQPKLEKSKGHVDTPQGLPTRTSIGGSAPRQSFKLERSNSVQFAVPETSIAAESAKPKLTRSLGMREAPQRLLERSEGGRMNVPGSLIGGESVLPKLTRSLASGRLQPPTWSEVKGDD